MVASQETKKCFYGLLWVPHACTIYYNQFLNIDMHKDVHCCIVYTRQNKSNTTRKT